MGKNAAKKPLMGRVLMASDGDENHMRKTKSAKDLLFSMPQHARRGEPALIFTRKGLIGRAKIATEPKKSEEYPTHGERPVKRGEIDGLELLHGTILNDDVIYGMREMPEEWIWHKHPRRSFNTPSKEHFDKLKEIFEEAFNKRPSRVAPKKLTQDDDDVKAFEDELAGYEKDPAKRRAVEKRAIELATVYYEAAGFTVKDVSENKLGYDLRCTGKKKEVHAEVKGTTTNGARVELTINEVNHARMNKCPCRADLFVVSKIKVTKTQNGPTASGGVSHPFENWKPEDDDLAPIRFRYKVPS